MVVMIGQNVATGYCQHCRDPITLTRWETGEERWTHDGTCDPTCAGAPVAEPAKYLVAMPPPRNHKCPLPHVVTEGAVWRCPECTIPWEGSGRDWHVVDWTYVGPTRAVRDEPQA